MHRKQRICQRTPGGGSGTPAQHLPLWLPIAFFFLIHIGVRVCHHHTHCFWAGVGFQPHLDREHGRQLSAGGRFVEGGTLAPGGKLPVNTNGGGLSCVHPGMYGIFALIEAVRQLRGEAHPKVQVKDHGLVLAHGTGGSLGTRHVGSTVILERE